MSNTSTPINYTCTNLAEHLEGMSHDVVSDFLKRARLTAGHLWELVEEQIDDSADAYHRSVQLVSIEIPQRTRQDGLVHQAVAFQW